MEFGEGYVYGQIASDLWVEEQLERVDKAQKIISFKNTQIAIEMGSEYSARSAGFFVGASFGLIENGIKLLVNKH